MTEIEIYAKIMEIVENEDLKDTLFALDFARNRIQNNQYARENAMYAKQAAYANQCAQGVIGTGAGLAASYPTPAFNIEKAAEDAVRKIAQEEIAKANPDTKAEAA